MEFRTKIPFETKKLGEILAKEILKSNFKNSVVLALKGDLGGGKTTFLQGFAKGLGIKQKITSPTFVIIKRFKLNNLKTKQFSNFYHIDCYRVENEKEVLNLGFKEIVSNPKNIVAIEWADKIGKIVPKNSLKIDFKFIDKNNRKINVNLKKI